MSESALDMFVETDAVVLLDLSLKPLFTTVSEALSPLSGAILRSLLQFSFCSLISGGNQPGDCKQKSHDSRAGHLVDASGDLSSLQERHFGSRGIFFVFTLTNIVRLKGMFPA